MKPNVIYLVRHGESEGNVNEELYKTVADYRIHLTEKGRGQAFAAGQKIGSQVIARYKNVVFPPSVFIYTSPWIRARETTTGIIVGLQTKNILVDRTYEDPRLREQEWGNYKEDILQAKINRERKAFGTFFYRMPHGESGADVYDRITTFIDTLYRDFNKHDSRTIIIVSHGLAIKAFLTRWYHWTHEQFDNYKNTKNCEILKMVLNKEDKYDLKTPMRLRAGAK